MQIERPVEIAGANPRQSTLHEIENVLRAAAEKREGPLSFAEIGRRLAAAKTRPEAIRAAVADLCRYKLAVLGSKGVMWVVAPESVWNRPHRPLR